MEKSDFVNSYLNDIGRPWRTFLIIFKADKELVVAYQAQIPWAPLNARSSYGQRLSITRAFIHSSFYGSWLVGSGLKDRAGGCLNHKDSFLNNPQFRSVSVDRFKLHSSELSLGASLLIPEPFASCFELCLCLWRPILEITCYMG